MKRRILSFAAFVAFGVACALVAAGLFAPEGEDAVWGLVGLAAGLVATIVLFIRDGVRLADFLDGFAQLFPQEEDESQVFRADPPRRRIG